MMDFGEAQERTGSVDTCVDIKKGRQKQLVTYSQQQTEKEQGPLTK